VSLLVGIIFILGFVISLVVIMMKQHRIKFIVASLKLAKLCFWDNIYMFGVSIILSGISIGVFYVNIIFIRYVMVQMKGQVIVAKMPVVYLILF
jgi:hypothetical protein